MEKNTERMLTDPTFNRMRLNELGDDEKEIVRRIQMVAERRSVTMAIISMAWTLHKGCNPIVGLNSVERVDEAVKAIEFTLTEDEIKLLEEPYKPKVRIF